VDAAGRDFTGGQEKTMTRRRGFAVSLTALAAVLVVVAPLTARGQLPGRNGSGDATAGWQEKNPFGRLFITPDTQKSEPSDPQKTDPAIVERPGMSVGPPKVVCGMTVIQADPGVDPNILVKPAIVEPTRRNLKPVRGKIEYKIRSIAPPICH
jgi:hypothetical protein